MRSDTMTVRRYAFILAAAACAAAAPAEVLYNGIALPESWPPVLPMTYEPMPLPYLGERPAVIPIDRGRQLLVDTFLIDSTTGLERVAHTPRKLDRPVLVPQTEAEMGTNGNPGASAKDGGVWWDPADGIFKMWYEAGWLGRMALATSADGLHWERPDLDVVPGTNIIIPDIVADSSTAWIDYSTDRPDERYKMFLRSPNSIPGSKKRFNYGYVLTSPDGIHWSEPLRTGRCGDRSTMFYNPFRDKWVFSIRNAGDVSRCPIGRCRLYREDADFARAAAWDYDSLHFWLGADYRDAADPYIGDRPQLYNLSAVAYESIMISLPQIHLGPDNSVCRLTGAPKITELKVAYSRDGFHWDRTDRQPFIPASRYQGAWDRGYVQSVGGVCTVVGDELWFYYIGFSGNSGRRDHRSDFNGMHYGGSTGVAALRRDGFVSMRAGDTDGILTTRPLTFSGSHLFVNVDCPDGEIVAEVVDPATGKAVPGFEMSRCRPLTADTTIGELSWRGHADLASLAGRPVQLRFRLRRGDLYAFWVSPSPQGESGGYVAAGGPGYSSNIDREGKAAYRAAATYPSLLRKH